MSHEHDLQAELARLRSEMLALLAVNQTMRASRDLASLYRAVAVQLNNVVRSDSLFIALYLPEIDSVRFVYSVDEGVIDAERAERVLEQVLAAVIARQADRLVIDVTGLAGVDAQVIAQLMKIVRATGLLGARSSIVGISSTLASLAATLDLGMHEIMTYRDLRSALADILRGAG